MTVSAHVERGIDFTAYRSYDWGAPDRLPVGDPRLDNNAFFNDYLQGAIEKKMAAQGYDRARHCRTNSSIARPAPCWCWSTRTPISLSTSSLRCWRAATCGIDSIGRPTRSAH